MGKNTATRTGSRENGKEEEAVHCFSHQAMATLYQVFISHPDAEYSRQAARRAFQCLDVLEQDLSRFIENSDVSRISHAVVGERLILGEATMECLQMAVIAYLETAGAFDITLGSGMESIQLDPDNMTVEILATGLCLDLGGIGKGYAIDRMANELRDWDITRFLIHGGQSSVLAAGAPYGKTGWGLRLGMPGAREVELLRLEAENLVVSGSGLEKGEHIIDPHRGIPVKEKSAIWVWAEADPEGYCFSNAFHRQQTILINAAMVDALSTAFMVMDLTEIEAFCQKHPRIQTMVINSRDQTSEPAVYRFGTNPPPV